MQILQVKDIGGAVIATIVVGRNQYLEGESERIVQVPFSTHDHDSREAFVWELIIKYFLQAVLLVVDSNPLSLLRVQGLW